MKAEEYHKKFNELYGKYEPSLSPIDKAAEKFVGDFAKRVFKDTDTDQEIDLSEKIKMTFKAGAEWASPRWISVNEKLPPEDEEVIVLTNEANGHTLPIACHLCFAHIVSDKTMFVDYDGWNIPQVRYWMPCPELPEK